MLAFQQVAISQTFTATGLFRPSPAFGGISLSGSAVQSPGSLTANSSMNVSERIESRQDALHVVKDGTARVPPLDAARQKFVVAGVSGARSRMNPLSDLRNAFERILWRGK